MGAAEPTQILDLGAGKGSLSLAAVARWLDARVLTVDIDSQARSHLRSVLGNANGAHLHLRANALDIRLPEIIGRASGVMDGAVCNPPFVLPRWRKCYSEILHEAGFVECVASARQVEAPMLFLAQNMRILKSGSTLGIILPDSLLSSARHQGFRSELLSNYWVRRVIKLPRHSFRGTDAQAHVVIIEKRRSPSALVSLCRLDESGSITMDRVVSRESAIIRIDFDYHSETGEQTFGRLGNSLAQLGVEVKRGRLERRNAVAEGLPAVHTTDLHRSSLGRWVKFQTPELDPEKTERLSSMLYAEKGDILLARVGRNLDEKIVGVLSGRVAITDCIYRIRAPASIRPALLTALSSSLGRSWLRSRSYGVSALQLPKSALLEFVL
jgi:type I restriction enzyme M protein